MSGFNVLIMLLGKIIDTVSDIGDALNLTLTSAWHTEVNNPYFQQNL